MMRALVVSNVLARREETVLFVPVNPATDPGGRLVAAAVGRIHRLAGHAGRVDVHTFIRSHTVHVSPRHRRVDTVLQQHGWFSRRLAGLAQATRSLSPLQAIEYLLKRDMVTKALGLDSFRLHSKYALHPLLCRRDSSDRAVFGQIFIKREYRCLDDVQNASLILDCGANCGYSAAYFLSRYPQSFVVAVEPDSGNVQALKNNLEPYMGRYRVVQSGVWPREAGPVVEGNSDFGDGRDWARAVREAGTGRLLTCRPRHRATAASIRIRAHLHPQD